MCCQARLFTARILSSEINCFYRCLHLIYLFLAVKFVYQLLKLLNLKFIAKLFLLKKEDIGWQTS